MSETRTLKPVMKMSNFAYDRKMEPFGAGSKKKRMSMEYRGREIQSLGLVYAKLSLIC